MKFGGRVYHNQTMSDLSVLHCLWLANSGQSKTHVAYPHCFLPAHKGQPMSNVDCTDLSWNAYPDQWRHTCTTSVVLVCTHQPINIDCDLPASSVSCTYRSNLVKHGMVASRLVCTFQLVKSRVSCLHWLWPTLRLVDVRRGLLASSLAYTPC